MQDSIDKDAVINAIKDKCNANEYDLEKMYELILEIIKIKKVNTILSDEDFCRLISRYNLWNYPISNVSDLLAINSRRLETVWNKAIGEEIIWEALELQVKKIKKLLNEKNLWIYALLDGQSPKAYFQDLQRRVYEFFTSRFNKAAEECKACN